jgi:hypothetical protein
MSVGFRERMRKPLLESYLHRHVDDCECSMCGQSGVPLAFHVIEKTISDKYGESADAPFEQGFVPFASMSSSTGYIRGSFPLCPRCAPPCKKCDLPMDTLSVHNFAISVRGTIALGACREHIHWPSVFKGLLARIFHFGARRKRHSTTPKTKLLRDFMEADAEALRDDNRSSEAESGTEARYFQDVNDVIRTMGDRGDLALYAQLNPDFMKASMEVCEVGFECYVPARVVGRAIADAADHYRSNPKLSIEWLQETRNNIPRLWPEVTEPALQNQVAQLLDKKGKT